MESPRARIRAFLELPPPPPPPAPVVSVVEQITEDGYTRSLLTYAAADGDAIEAFLFQPLREEPRAAVLALHQHNSQWTIGKSEIAGLSGDPFQAFGPALARHGIAVLAPDAVGFESRLGSRSGSTHAATSLAPPLNKPQSTADGWLQYYNQMAHRLVQGDLLMRKALTDCELAVSVLQALVPAPCVGAIGHSYGGILTLFLAAVDTRISFACSSGAACSFRHKLAHGLGLDMSLIIPGFVTRFDLHDVIGSVAPRKLFLISADDDPASADADQLVRHARPFFQAQNCPEHLQHLRVAGAHALDRPRFNAILDWTLEEGR
jgi:dienelactone hydrolase